MGPVLERELALLFESEAPAEELARDVVSWAFDRGLVLRSSLDERLAFVIVSRDGASRAARVVDAPSRPPRPRGEKSEWMTAMPARRRA
jgi:hypothetical protein